ncbi:T9SS type A sorting domain-containing protein, partial [bacterium]|nr:T9SS type A sorting domain-containing protein [bacterium]
ILFGEHVAIDGEWAVVGAHRDSEAGSSVGAAYIYHLEGSTWVEYDKIFPSDPDSLWYFGSDVDISGDRIIAGTSSHDNDRGAAYVFELQGGSWTEIGKLTPSNGYANCHFGETVGIDGNYAVVGAESDKIPPNIETGAIYIFRQEGSNWIEYPKIVPEDIAGYDDFGAAVAISGDYIIASAPANNPVYETSGAIYIYHREGTEWSQQDKVWALDDDQCNFFGYSVDIDGDNFVVGDLGWDNDPANNYDNRGAAYVFERNGNSWFEAARLLADDGVASDNLGRSVGISGDFVIAGSPSHGELGYNSGAAYLFSGSGGSWSQMEKITAGDGGEDQVFGYAVAVGTDHLIVGKPWDDDMGEDAGSAYVYSDLIPVEPEDIPGQISRFILHQNYPNPFNSQTCISFYLPAATSVLLEVFDLNGRRVSILADGEYHAGGWSVNWDADHLASGIYLYHFATENFSYTRKMVLLK